MSSTEDTRKFALECALHFHLETTRVAWIGDKVQLDVTKEQIVRTADLFDDFIAYGDITSIEDDDEDTEDV